MPFILNCVSESYGDMAKLGAIAVNAVAEMNIVFFRNNPRFAVPALQAGFMYDPPPVHYRTHNHSICQAPILIDRKVGKCDSLTAWDIAVRRINGQNAFCGIKPQGGGLFHVVTFIRSGGKTIEFDSSEQLPRFNGSGCQVNGTDHHCEC